VNDKTLDCSDIDRYIGKKMQPARMVEPLHNNDFRRCMPRPYGCGASMVSWVTDYAAGWAGEWGQVLHHKTPCRGPAFSGDIIIMTGEATDKFIDDKGCHVVQVSCRMFNQDDITMASAKGEIALPRR